MSFDATGKRKQADSNVRDPLVEIITTLRLNREWHFSHQPQDQGYVVWREGPENVFFAPNAPKIQSIGTDVLNSAQLTVGNDFLKLNNGWMIPEQVTHHQDTGGLGRKRNQFFSFLNRQTQWLFHKDILTCFQRTQHQFPVSCCGGSDSHSSYLWVLQDILQ